MATLKYRDENGEWKTLGIGKMPSWNDITDKPDDFSPAPHTHAQSDVAGLVYELSSKVDKYVAPFESVTYNGIHYRKWKILDGASLSLVLDVDGADITVARFYSSTGKFMMSLPNVLFDGVAGIVNVSPVIGISGMLDGVKHSDFSDVKADLSPKKSSIADIMEKLNSVIDILKGSSLMLLASIISLSAIGAVSVQTDKLSNIFMANPETTYLVTNVVGAAAASDLAGLQPKLTAGDNIEISSDNVIRGEVGLEDLAGLQPKLTAGSNVTISAENVISSDVGPEDIRGLQGKLTAGSNITISAENVISATLGIYTPWNLVLSQTEMLEDNLYRSASMLVSVSSPTNVEIGVGSKTFAYLPYLKSIQIGTLYDDDEPIADDAFLGLSLDYLTISNRVAESFGWPGIHGFAGADVCVLDIPAVTEMPDEAGVGMSIKSLSANGMQAISDRAFLSCTHLTEIKGLASCKSIGKQAFRKCGNLEKVCSLPNCVILDEYAFSCDISGSEVKSKLTQFGDIPSCREVRAHAFNWCDSLASLGSLASCTNVGKLAFARCYYIPVLRLGSLAVLADDAFTGLGRYVDSGTAIHTTICVKNTTASLLTSHLKDGKIGDSATYNKFYCKNGYIAYVSGAWTATSYSSIDDLPHPGYSEYIYVVGSKTYRWNDGEYQPTTAMVIGNMDVNDITGPSIRSNDPIDVPFDLHYENASGSALSDWVYFDKITE